MIVNWKAINKMIWSILWTFCGIYSAFYVIAFYVMFPHNLAWAGLAFAVTIAWDYTNYLMYMSNDK